MTNQQNIDPLDILAQLGWGEGDDLEFKSAKGGLPQSLWQTYSGMANTSGGVIFLGVENDGTVSGLADPNKMKKHFWDTINNKTRVSVNLLVNSDVQTIEHPSGVVIAIHVPRASRYQRPIFIGQNPLTGTYRRNHEGDYHCTEQEVSRMLADRSEESVDSRILEHFTIEDLDLPSFHQFRQRFASHKPTHPWLSEDDKGLLTKLGGWRICKDMGRKGLTVAGMLMFGREETIRETVPQYLVDFREKFSDDLSIRWTDRMTLDGTWPGNLFQFYVRVIQKLAADLKLPFQLDADLYRKGETVVHEAIREALVNALIHADYLGQGGVVIEKYRDRFEFSNPGSLLISLEQLLHGNVSECRNKSLQTMFTMIGAAEKAGSGIDKIRRGWNSQHWRSPMIRESMQPDRVLWTFPMMSLIPDKSLARLRLRFGTKFQKLSPLEVQALVTADLEQWVDNARMRQITSEHAADMTRLLQKLVSQGMLVQDGQGRWTRYRLPPLGDSLHNRLHSLHKGADSLHNDGHSLHREELPNNEWDELEKIADLAKQRRRLSAKPLEAILLRLCENRWLTRRQLAELLRRNEEGLRSRFLAPMVEHGILRLRYPEKPNRVDQAYTKNTREPATKNSPDA
ncbi:MAG TPA: RNA-binding domain-containing protein [Chlamydiales bacterium]|nr:RNA-binding domain-containing protein [Chlamydiales bacterium]